MTIQTESSPKPFIPEDDLLWRQLKTIPAFRAVLRAVESRFYYAVDLPGPTLDLGCGDGHFAQMTFDRKLDVGIDPWWNPLQKSVRADAYNLVLQGMGDKMPFPDKSFASAFSNSVLEHIPDIQPVLNETGRVLQENGRFLITMPSHYFTQELGGAQFLEKMNMDGMADRYRQFFNGISRHEHTDGPEVWATRLAQAGFAIERWQYYFSTEALHALELGHLQGMPSAIMHALTKTWIVAPWTSSLKWTDKWVRPFYEEEAATDKGAYLLIVAKKVADGPVPVNLPPARPFTIAELETATSTKLSAGVAAKRQPLPSINDEAAGTDEPTRESATLAPPLFQEAVSPAPEPTAPPPVSEEKPKSRFDLIAAGLIGLTVLCALIGQMLMSQNPADLGSGIRWFLFSFIAMFFLAWRMGAVKINKSGWKRPSFSPKNVPRKRWYYLLALVIVFFSFRQANSFPPWPAWLTITLWVVGIITAHYSLREISPTQSTNANKKTPRKFLILAGLLLFATALIIRFADLGGHPWILNGLESSVGLDVQNIASGAFRNPFSTGWLTLPTLPLFLMAIPVKLLGSTVIAIRFLSPFVGALTVLATFWIGAKLWRLEVGLIAAVLLTGSHFHIHYSRLGFPAVWDGLLMLLALGLLGMAWGESKGENGRRSTWLWAGLAIGLNVYAYTPSRILPLMLLLLLLVAVLFQQGIVRAQFRNILAALALAFIVALPQLLTYNTHSGLFMERFNELTVFNSDWLAQEALFAGKSEVEVLAQQMQKALLAFNTIQDKSPAFGSNKPLLGSGLALLFILGVMMAILRGRQHQYGMALLWLLVPLGWGVLLIESPSSHRLVAVLPIICLLAALALVTIGEWVIGLYKSDEPMAEKSKQFLLPVLLVVAALIALSEILFYFGPYRQGHTFADRNTEIAHGVADYLNTLDGATTTAYFYGPPHMYISFPTIPFLTDRFTANENLFDILPEGETAVIPEPNNPSLTFIFLPERAQELEAVQTGYPNGEQKTISGFHANPLFYTYEVTP